MKPRWRLFYGRRLESGLIAVTVRSGAVCASSGFHDTIEDALVEAGRNFEEEFHPLLTDETDLSALLSD